MSLLAVLAAQQSTTTPPSSRNPSPPSGTARNIAGFCEAASLGKTPANRDAQAATTTHRAVVDATSLLLAWVHSISYGPDTGATVAATVTVAGSTKNVTVGGSTTWRVEKPVNGTPTTITADPITVDVLAGDLITVKVTADADGDTGGISSSYTGPTGNESAWALRPSRIVAPTNIPAWLCVGDSIAQQELSFPGRACELRGYPWATSAQGGDAYLYYPGRFNEKVKPHLPYYQRMIDQFGINDVGGTSTQDVYAQRAINYWKNAKDNGIEVIVKPCITVSASSTNGYADLAGQTPSRQPGIANFNAWLRDGAPITADRLAPLPAGTTDAGAIRARYVRPDGTIKAASGGTHWLDGISDVTAVIESPVEAGKFIPGKGSAYYGDGTHPGAGMHADLGDRLARDLGILGY